MASATMETRGHDQETTLDDLIARKTEIDAMFDRLKALSDEHFGYSPDEINWGHVGTLNHYAELLKRITDSAVQDAEYAR